MATKRQNAAIGRVNQNDLIRDVARRSGITYKEAKKVTAAVVSAIQDNLLANYEVVIQRFGVFYLQKCKPRVSHLPKAHGTYTPARLIPKFSFDFTFRSDIINRSINKEIPEKPPEIE